MIQLVNLLRKGDKIVLGVDLIKSQDIVLPAYSGPHNLNFKLNILKRINDELGGNFNLSKFSNVSTYTKAEGILRDFVKSEEKQHVYIRAIDRTYELKNDEMIQIDVSYKYDDNRVRKLFSNTRVKFLYKHMDTRSYFADYIYECL